MEHHFHMRKALYHIHQAVKLVGSKKRTDAENNFVFKNSEKICSLIVSEMKEMGIDRD